MATPAPDAAAPPRTPLPQHPNEADCTFYLKTGHCRFGQACKFHHPVDREAAAVARGVMASSLNTAGLPLRPGGEPCGFYLRTGGCKFGATCKFDHPEHVLHEKAMGGAAPGATPGASLWNLASAPDAHAPPRRSSLPGPITPSPLTPHVSPPLEPPGAALDTALMVSSLLGEMDPTRRASDSALIRPRQPLHASFGLVDSDDDNPPPAAPWPPHSSGLMLGNGVLHVSHAVQPRRGVAQH